MFDNLALMTHFVSNEIKRIATITTIIIIIIINNNSENIHLFG